MGKSASQETLAAGSKLLSNLPDRAAPPAGMGYDDTGTLRPLSEIRTFGQPQPVAPTPTPMVTPSGPNVFQQAQGYQAQAGQALGGLAGFQPQTAKAAQISPASTMQGVGAAQAAQAPDQIQVGQLASTNLGSYMSPYTQQVIERGEADIARQREQALNQLGASATAAGAFGGSRQGLAEGETYGQYGRMAADFAAQQREKAYQQALGAAQYDIGQTQAARTLASQQQFQASQLGQQAREAAAAREQAARSGNMAAANQFAMQQAQLQQQANLSNQQAGISGAGIRQAGAGGLAGLGQQLFGQGRQVQQEIGQQAAFQRSLQQRLLDLQKQQFGQATGAPLSGLGAMSQIMAQTPYSTTTTQQTSTPFNPATLAYAFL